MNKLTKAEIDYILEAVQEHDDTCGTGETISSIFSKLASQYDEINGEQTEVENNIINLQS